jgi:glycosyltransferase involved in cell wall biosynthesis
VTSKLRIAMVSYYLPSESRIGVGHQVHAPANALVDRGHEVTVFSGCGPSDEARYETVKVPLSGSNRTFKFAWQLRGINWSPFDIVHAHGDDNLLRGGRPVRVRTMHGSCFAEARWVGSMRHRLRMTVLGLGELVSTVTPADQVVAVSQNTHRGLPWVQTVIPNGVDAERFAPAQRSEKPSSLLVGSYHWRRRGEFLADVSEGEVAPRLPEPSSGWWARTPHHGPRCRASAACPTRSSPRGTRARGRPAEHSTKLRPSRFTFKVNLPSRWPDPRGSVRPL